VLAHFRSGDLDVVVSVKSLVEGIDVPDADVGVSVASSSSVRQRIQTLGRVLRRRFDGGEKQAEMHVIYVHDTVDQSIYGKEDWSDLTGADANQYWLWPLDSELPPEVQLEPPLKPRASEDAEWKRLGERIPSDPVLWLGELPAHEFSVDTRGNVSTSAGAAIENPQGVSAMVERVRGRPGGRFRITPLHHLVIVYGESEERMSPFLAGQLGEPLRVQAGITETDVMVDVATLEPGSPYPGALDKTKGTYKLRQKRGGVIEKSSGSLSQFAILEGEADPRVTNANHCIMAWKSLGMDGFTFYVNRSEHAWYRTDGEAKFLANVPGGFLWPDLASEDPSLQRSRKSTET
jgi:hypothetical protein